MKRLLQLFPTYLLLVFIATILASLFKGRIEGGLRAEVSEQFGEGFAAKLSPADGEKGCAAEDGVAMSYYDLSLDEATRSRLDASGAAAKLSNLPKLWVSEGGQASQEIAQEEAPAPVDSLVEAEEQNLVEDEYFDDAFSQEGEAPMKALAVEPVEPEDVVLEEVADLESTEEIVPQEEELVSFDEEETPYEEVPEEIQGEDSTMLAQERQELKEEVAGILKKLQVYFASNSDAVSTGQLGVVQEAAMILQELGGEYKLLVGGHADSTGNAEYNKQLSIRRAGAVRDLLVKNGVASESIEVVSFGEEDTVQTNDVELSKQLSRRVEIRFQD